jgi:hypothetical protein
MLPGMATETIRLAARVNRRRLDHEYRWLRARLWRIPKRERGAFFDREVRRIAGACVRVVTA